MSARLETERSGDTSGCEWEPCLGYRSVDWDTEAVLLNKREHGID